MNKKVLLIAGATLILAIVIAFLAYSALIGHRAPRIVMSSEASALKGVHRLLDKGDEDGAIKELEVIAAKYPESAEAESSLFSLASIYEKRRELAKTKETYQKIIERFPNSDNISKSEEGLDKINIAILFSQIPTDDSFIYEVQKGDTLAKLAKKFNTTIELISKANNISDSIIRVGKRLKVSKAKFSIVVDKSQNILTLKSDGKVIKTYKVSTGKDFSTPTGNFTITNKIPNPTWYTTGAAIPPESPNNILGSRWIGISQPGYGIHGTTKPETIGRQVTAGCVRMTNAEVEELYAIVPEGTEVVIVD